MLLFYMFIYMISGLCFWYIILLLRLRKKNLESKYNKELSDLVLLKKSNKALAISFSLTMFSIAGIPPMIGFLLRHGRVDNDVFFLFHFRHLHERFNGFFGVTYESKHRGVSDETLSEGCVKWGKSQNVDEETSTLDLTSVIFLSLTKVNYCYKDGSAIPVSFNRPLRFRGIISVKKGASGESVFQDC